MQKEGARKALLSSVSVEWYTPSVYVDAAREVMGSIDLDPASCLVANKSVKATKIYTKDTNGLDKTWEGNVWMNPPYGPGGQARWTSKMIEEYESDNIEQGIILVNSATDTIWFSKLWPYLICFVKRRIKFESREDSQKHSPTHGNVFVYLGPEEGQRKFISTFSEFGTVVAERVPKHCLAL